MVLALLAVAVCSIGLGAQAGEADLKARVKLARKMVELQPTGPQVEQAVDAYIKANMNGYSDEDRALFRQAMMNVINPKALDKATVDAYASTYSEDELEAMVEYYSKPEARSATEKQGEFAAKITPEIIRMLDTAVLRVREATTP